SFELLTRLSAEDIPIKMQLLLRRPPYKQHHHYVPPEDDFDVMESSTLVLETHMGTKIAELSPWSWKDWFPWYALAIVLAELVRNPKGPWADRGWAAAQTIYRQNAVPVTDLEGGMLWKPITKLMRRVQRGRTPAPSAQTSALVNAPAGQPPAQYRGTSQAPWVTAFDATFDNVDPRGFASLPLMTQPPPLSNVGGTALPATTTFDFDPSLKLYNDLNPATGVSWLNWDFFLDDTTLPMDMI
ncbi:MAG: hypothetical protein INR71_01875, partial [Terriglobus roseus]|nr:hypothetical protein [Terriglobus roseus]